MKQPFPRLADVLPSLAAALRESLIEEGESDLADQVDTAEVHALCGCDDPACLTVYLAPERGPCVGAHRVVMPQAVVTLEVCREQLDYIEDNEDLTPAARDPARRREYEALRPKVPSRLP